MLCLSLCQLITLIVLIYTSRPAFGKIVQPTSPGPAVGNKFLAAMDKLPFASGDGGGAWSVKIAYPLSSVPTKNHYMRSPSQNQMRKPNLVEVTPPTVAPSTAEVLAADKSPLPKFNQNSNRPPPEVPSGWINPPVPIQNSGLIILPAPIQNPPPRGWINPPPIIPNPPPSGWIIIPAPIQNPPPPGWINPPPPIPNWPPPGWIPPPPPVQIWPPNGWIQPPVVCEGFSNFMQDLGRMSYTISTALLPMGIMSMMMAATGQVYSYLSTYGIAIPSLIIEYLEDNGQLSPAFLSTIYDRLNLVDTVMQMIFTIPMGDMFMLVCFASFLASIFTWILDTMGVFQEMIERSAMMMFDMDLNEQFQGYGCENRGPPGPPGPGPWTPPNWRPPNKRREPRSQKRRLLANL